MFQPSISSRDPRLFVCPPALDGLSSWLAARPAFNAAIDVATIAGPSIGLRHMPYETDIQNWSPAGLIVCRDRDMRRRAYEAVADEIVRRNS